MIGGGSSYVCLNRYCTFNISLVKGCYSVGMDETSETAAGTQPAGVLDDPRLTVIGLLAETYAGLSGKLTAQLARHRLGTLEFEVLMRLSRTPGGSLRMSDLAAQTSMSSSGITRVIDRLAGNGLVRREACRTDRRTTYAVVTDLGRARVEAAVPEHINLVEQWLVGPLTEVQLEGLVEALRVVRDGVRPCATAGAAGAPGHEVSQPTEPTRASLS
jgi:MarR family 2-MHQ and catechol resistance regulon transcriptional repressor